MLHINFFLKAATKLNAQGDKKGKKEIKTIVRSAKRKQQGTSYRVHPVKS